MERGSEGEKEREKEIERGRERLHLQYTHRY